MIQNLLLIHILALPTGTTLVARASLASVGQVVQYPFCCGTREALNLEGLTARTRHGPECEGEHALLHCYKTKDDSWILLTASLLPLSRLPTQEREAVLTRLAAADCSLGAAVATPPLQKKQAAPSHDQEDEALASRLSAAFGAKEGAEWWVEALGGAGVRATVLASFGALRASCTRPADQCCVDSASAAPTVIYIYIYIYIYQYI